MYPSMAWLRYNAYMDFSSSKIQRDADSHNGNIEHSGAGWAHIVFIAICTYRLYIECTHACVCGM